MGYTTNAAMRCDRYRRILLARRTLHLIRFPSAVAGFMAHSATRFIRLFVPFVPFVLSIRHKPFSFLRFAAARQSGFPQSPRW